MIVRNRTQVIGGITYRTFPGTPAARLGEIAFCAVAQTLQVTGYGTRLMNWTKVGEQLAVGPKQGTHPEAWLPALRAAAPATVPQN